MNGGIYTGVANSEVSRQNTSEFINTLEHPLGEFDFYLAPGHLIRRAQQVHSAVWLSIIGEELTSPQFAVINVLYENPGVDQTSLSVGASLDTSTCQDIVTRLRERGIVERVKDPSDGRRWLLSLSKKGRILRDEVVPKVMEVGNILFGQFSEQDRSEFKRLLLNIATNVSYVKEV